MNNSPLIFATGQSEYLADGIAAHIPGSTRGEIKRTQFKDGEGRMIISNIGEIRGQRIMVVGSLLNDQEHAEMCDLLSAMRQTFGARTVHGVIPYLQYQTAERSPRGSGEVPRGIYRTQALFDTRPDLLTFFDLHAEGIKEVGGREGRSEHLYSEEVILAIIESIRQKGETVLVSPDEGRIKWVQALAERAELGSYWLTKSRAGADDVRATGQAPDLHGKHAVMFDDMIRTGNTAITQGERCKKEAGALSVNLIATHAVLPEQSEQRFNDSDAFDTVHVTNSHPRSQTIVSDKFTVHDISKLIADQLLVHYAD